MAFPITPVIDLSNGLLCTILAWKLHISYKKNPSNQVLHIFATAYIFLIFAYAAFSLPRLIISSNTQAIGVGFLVANAFLFLAAAYLVRVTMFFFKTTLQKPLFWIFLILALGVMIVGVIHFSEPSYNPATGLTNWNIDPTFGTLTTVLFLIVLVPSSLFFFYQGIKTRDAIVRVRSVFIALGIALLLIAVGTYYTATNSTLFFISDIFSLSAFLTIFIGVYYKRTLIVSRS